MYNHAQSERAHLVCSALSTIIRHEADEGIVIFTRTLELVNDLADIVIDALDECSDDDREETLLSFLNELVSSGKTGDVRIFVTSRPESDIKEFFRMHDTCTHTESLHTEEHRNTLRRFISLELQKPKYGPERLGWSHEFRAQVARTLLEKSDDM